MFCRLCYFGELSHQLQRQVSLQDYEVNDVKNIFDLEHDRNIKCRNSDGLIPAETTRILTTNDEWNQFLPPMAFHPSHLDAIRRRVVWVKLQVPCLPPSAPRPPSESKSATSPMTLPPQDAPLQNSTQEDVELPVDSCVDADQENGFNQGLLYEDEEDVFGHGHQNI